MSEDIKIADDDDRVSRIQRIQEQREHDEMHQQAMLDLEQTVQSQDMDPYAVAATEETRDQAQLSHGSTMGQSFTEGSGGSQECMGVIASARAVDTAHTQQDRGLAWTDFAQTSDARDLPPRPEDSAAKDRGKEQSKQEQLNAQQLLDQIKIQGRKIDA